MGKVSTKRKVSFKKQVLTPAVVIRAARKFYRAKRLTAQHPDPSKRQCVFQQGRYRCAIGAALNERLLRRLKRERHSAPCSVHGLELSGYIDTWSVPNLDELQNIQQSHDLWAHSPSYERLQNEDKFREVLGLKPLKRERAP